MNAAHGHRRCPLNLQSLCSLRTRFYNNIEVSWYDGACLAIASPKRNHLISSNNPIPVSGTGILQPIMPYTWYIMTRYLVPGILQNYHVQVCVFPPYPCPSSVIFWRFSYYAPMSPLCPLPYATTSIRQSQKGSSLHIPHHASPAVAASAAAAREAAAAGNGEIMPATSLFVRKVCSYTYTCSILAL